MGCRFIIRIALAVVALECVAPVSGGELGEFLSDVARDTKRRNAWPEPFLNMDKQTSRQVWMIEVNAGWERQNLLSEFHFTPNSAELTEAGRLRVQWIMSEASEPHRQIYVHRGNSPQETVARMQAVQRFVAQSPYASNVPVLESTRTDDGWPADRIDSLSRKAATAALDPKLPGGGGAGGGTGGH